MLIRPLALEAAARQGQWTIFGEVKQMALVKKTRVDLESHNDAPPRITEQPAVSSRDADALRRKARTLAKQQQAAERIAAASAELASGINEAASASEELRRASDTISAGAQQASSAAQQSLQAVTAMTSAIAQQMQGAKLSQTRATSMQALAGSIQTDVAVSVSNVSIAAQRQVASVEMVAELERQAANIGDIVKAVARIADQTNLLALNAAIEAARAGKHGKGFAVVADEVRTLAETSEKSAGEIQQLVSQIQSEVKVISDGINRSANVVQEEVEKGKLITAQLKQVETDSGQIVAGADEIATAAQQASAGANQAMRGAESIAAAAEQQSSACEESAKTVSEQAQALAECEATAASLAEIAEDLKNSTNIAKSAEDVASAAEELSSAVQEINRASTQIMVAIDEIRKGAQTQAAACEESSSAVTQIESSSRLSRERAEIALERVKAIQKLLADNKANVDALVTGIKSSVETTRNSLVQIKELELVSRRIDKIVDAITSVSIQTNMLAVNGAIEAARAGEFGKGFVVVATDIRNLAHDSAENADRIKDMVKSVQDQIAAVRRDLEEIASAALVEVEKSKGITSALNQMEGDVAEVAGGSQQALTLADELAAQVSQVKAGVEQISAAAAEAEQAAGEAATAARQQSQGAEELSAAIEEIASLADELQSA